MSVTFTKLFSSITESTVWCEDHTTRIVWITMLAMADRRGRVFGSVPGLANRARVTVSECQSALSKFLNPDEFSRTKEHDGRRIVEMDGGWSLLNHSKYRNIRDEEERRAYKAEKQRDYREKEEVCGQNCPLWTSVDTGGHNAEAEAEAEKKKPLSKKKLSTGDSRFSEFVEDLNSYWKQLPNHEELPLPMDFAAGKNLKDFLGRYPHLSRETFQDWIRNLWDSDDVNPAFNVREIISRIHRYADGPLDKYGKLKRGQK